MGKDTENKRHVTISVKNIKELNCRLYGFFSTQTLAILLKVVVL